MANTRISNLTASASNLAATDVTPVVQTTGVGPVKMTGLQIAGGLLGSTALTGATITTSQPVLNLSQTWNASGVAFTGLLFTATNTASDQFSKLIDLKVGANTVFQVSRFPNMTVASAGTNFFDASTSALSLAAAVNIQWGSTSNASGTTDTFLRRAAAATLQLGAADTTGTTAPTAQFLRVQSWSSSTNNDQTGANFTIQGSRGTGAGAGGSIIFQVAPAGSSGTAQNAYSTALTINSAGKATFAPTVNSLNSFEITNLAGSVIVEVDSTNRRFNAGGPGGALSVSTSTGATTLYSAASFGWTDGGTATSGTLDVILRRDAANTLALRNGTSAQAFNVYNTYTDGSNYERGAFKWTSNELTIATENAGTGSARSITLRSASNIFVDITANLNIRLIGSGSATAWRVEGTTGHLVCPTDNTYDIGASGATRPRNVFVAGNVTGGGNIVSGSNSEFRFGSRASMGANGNGYFYIIDPNNANAGVTLNFTTNSVLKINNVANNAYAALESASLKTNAPSGGTSGTWKVGVYNATAPSATGYVEVDIGGTLYKLLAAT
jgi:hypothetical protein